jgi:hypothetical protein
VASGERRAASGERRAAKGEEGLSGIHLLRAALKSVHPKDEVIVLKALGSTLLRTSHPMVDQADQSDAMVQQVAEAYCADCVDFFLENAGIALDFSFASLLHIEMMADQLHRTMPPDIDDARVDGFAKMLGSYVGAVILQQVPGRWGQAPYPGGTTFPGLVFPSGACYPWYKARGRLVNGSEDNLCLYATWLIEQHQTKPRRSYIIKTKAGTFGPYSPDQLRELRATGKVTGTQVVSEVETNQLKRVDDVLAG